MGKRCTFGDHGSCTACRDFVEPTQGGHAHIFYGFGGENDLLCRACWINISIAAAPIFRAFQDANIKPQNTEDFARLIGERVIIGFQRPLVD